MRTITWKMMPTLNSYGWAEPDFQAAIRATWQRFYESIANVKFKEVAWRASANFAISCREIYIGNWYHARGTVGGTTIYLHNGWVAPGHSPYKPTGFWWKAFSTLEGAQQVAAHELCHMSIVGFGGNAAHCKVGAPNPMCTFSINAGPTWCPSHWTRIVRKFGALPKMAEAPVIVLCPETVKPEPEGQSSDVT